MATVYLGRARGIGGFERLVAVKCCHPHLRRDADFVSMFLDEARLAAKIHHPNVVPTLDVGDAEELYLVMEYCEGDRLATLVNRAAVRDSHIPIEVVLRIAIDVLSGLEAAHVLTDAAGRALHIVHRDVTPQNILVGVDGITRLVDFGVAKAEARANTTKDGALKGKVAYMAPEQIGAGEVSTQSDVFSAGVVLWEALAGRRLFRGETHADTARLILNETVEPPSRYRPEISTGLDAVVLRALARGRSSRFESAQAFADALERAAESIASTRQVASYVARELGDDLRSRRASLAAIADGPGSTPAETHVRRAAREDATAGARPARRSRRARWAVGIGGIGLIAAVLIMAATVLVGSAERRDAGASPPSSPPTNESDRARATPAPIGDGTSAPQAMPGSTAAAPTTEVADADARETARPRAARRDRDRGVRSAPRRAPGPAPSGSQGDFTRTAL
jgi:hypothetical protein